MKIPYYELSNYRIALRKFKSQWAKRKDKGAKLWEKVMGNALRLADAVDRIETAESAVTKEAENGGQG